MDLLNIIVTLMHAFAKWLKFNSVFFVIEVEIENPGHDRGFLRLS